MVKIGLLATLISAMSVGVGATLSGNLQALPEKDTSLIVEVNQSLKGLSREEIIASQNAAIADITANATRNIQVETRYTVLNNAFVIRCNNEDVEAIKNVKSVKSITENKIHWKKVLNDDETYAVSAEPVAANDSSSNVSAETMNFPAETNQGEGTVIAILDNEFHFRGVHERDSENPDDTGDAWLHETFSPIDTSTTFVRWDWNKVKSFSGLNAKRDKTKEAGEEGSLYFNSKVPFYYDYGGTTPVYGDKAIPDYDVHSEITYHGSHVASIAAGNADSYKGLAPKAQLACMKVFTEYKVDTIGDKLGLSTYSGAYDQYILAALEDCIALKVDGINMSLGSDLDDFDQDSITLRTLSRLADSNILTSIAAGNSGKASFSFAGAYGNWTKDMVETGILSSYANNEGVTTVASAQPTRIFYENALVIDLDGGSSLIAFDDQVVNREGYGKEYEEEHKLSDLFDGQTPLKYYYTGKFGAQSDYTNAVKAKVRGNIAVVNRGVSSFEDKYNYAKDAGAKGLIIVNNDPTTTDFNFRCSFGDTKPEIPVALVLFKDKPFFDINTEGEFKIIHNQEEENKTPRTISSYTSDGATYNFDLKPEISTPGESIKGATPPQTKEEKATTPLNTYKYLSGTSMAAPNYAGVQSVMLSNDGVAKDYYSKKSPSKAQTDAFNEYKNTIDMRVASTAVPMFDRDACPEDGDQLNLTSPRLQGAGMVNMSSALDTEVYLEGTEKVGEATIGTGKAKVSLRNNADIAKGTIKIDVIAHNEGEEKSYNGTLKVMRPATIMNNDIVTKDHKYLGEVEDYSLIPGLTYYTVNGMVTNPGTVNDGDTLRATKVINVWLTKEAFEEDHTYNEQTADWEENKVLVAAETFNIGNYKFNSKLNSTFKWEPLETKEYQSVQDYEIAEVDLGSIVIPEGDNQITLANYTLSETVRKEILKIYQYGCVIEGYVMLSSDSEPDLSLPYLGFYSGSDVDSKRSLDDVPVVEPFSFEKDPTTVYPSDLVNNIAKTLVGKDNANMGSLWVTGYAKSVDQINTDKILTNDLAFDQLTGWHNVGTDPIRGEYVADAKNNIFVGDRNNSNTMIIQQYVMRSVAKNNFEIKNEKGEVVYKSSLQDMLFGEQGGEYPLYKSHVDASYLSAGYIAHRAYAIIPLYNPENGEPFATGKYTITFNYLLSCSENWVNKSYDFNVVSDGSKFMKAEKKTTSEGKEVMRFSTKGNGILSAALGFDPVDVMYQDDVTYFEVPVETVKKAIKEVSKGTSGNRLFISFSNAAFASTNIILHFDENFTKCDWVEGAEFTSANDFVVNEDKTISFVKYNAFGAPEAYIPTGPVRTNVDVKTTQGGCGGSIIASSFVLFEVSMIAVALLAVRKIRRKKEN